MRRNDDQASWPNKAEHRQLRDCLTLDYRVQAKSLSAAVLADLDGKTPAQVDRYVKVARAVVKTWIPGKRQAAALAIISTTVSRYRKAQGWEAKRAKGAGRKPTKPRVDKLGKDTSKMTDYQKCEAALAYIRECLPDVSLSERNVFKTLAIKTLREIE